MARFGNSVETVSGTLISGMEAGEVFDFQGSTKGNNGLSVRLRDSKKGKNRFANLDSGKVLTASASDRGDTEVDLVDYV